MKVFKSFFSLALIALVLGLGACSKSNPAIQFANALDKLAKQADAIKSADEYQKLQSDVIAADAIISDNASYELTPEDKDVLKKSMSNFLRATFSKSFELQGIGISKDQIEMMANSAASTIESIKTLGQLNQPAPAEDTIIEETEVVEAVPADSVATE